MATNPERGLKDEETNPTPELDEQGRQQEPIKTLTGKLREERFEDASSPEFDRAINVSKLNVPEKPVAEGQKIELQDLEEAREKNYPWSGIADGVRESLSAKILGNEETLKTLAEGVKEKTPLHKQVSIAANAKYKERQKNGEEGTQESDFLSAIEDFKNLENVKKEMLQQRWQRLEVLSSEKNGATDDELNKRAYELAEKEKNQGNELSPIEANNLARTKLLIELREPITPREVKTELKRREEEIQQKIKEEAEAKEKQELEQKENALIILSDPKVMERQPREIIESFRNLTENEKGEHRRLSKERNEMATRNLQEKGQRVIIGKEAIEKYRQQSIEKEKKKIWAKERSMATTTFYDRLPKKKKEQFEKKGGISSLEFNDYLSQTRQKLGISENAFSSLINMKFEVGSSKVRRWGTWFRGPAIEIHTIENNLTLEANSKDDLNKWAEEQANERIKRQAEERTDLKITEGRERLLAEKNICAKIIIAETVEAYNLEKRKKQDEAEKKRIEEEQAEVAKPKKPKRKSLVKKTSKKSKAKKAKKK